MHSEKFQQITNGIQSIVFSIGLVLAGGWAYYQFVEKKYESLDIQLSASQINMTGEKGYIVKTILRIQNDGNTDIIFPLGNFPIVATKVSFDDLGEIINDGNVIKTGSYDFINDEKGLWLPSLQISPDSNKEVPFVFRVNDPGLYYIQLNSLDKDDGLKWIANTFILIEAKTK